MTARFPMINEIRAAVEDVNELSGERIPLLEKEGWMRGQKNNAKQP
jgi:hypothetical protein